MIKVEDVSTKLLNLYKEVTDKYEENLDSSIKMYRQSQRIRNELIKLSTEGYKIYSNMEMSSKDFEDIVKHITKESGDAKDLLRYLTEGD